MPPKVDIRSKFRKAIVNAHNKLDSFKNFTAEDAPEITMTRHRFDAAKEVWVTDEVKCILEPAAHNTALPGATREIFRMRLFSKWRGCDNYVAKKYREHVGATKEMYFLDCKMQMLAKNMAEKYNKLKPPHRIDFLECFVLEHTIDGVQHYWCAEKFIEGNYEKHSGNNGFVQEAHHRMTPHAFSHFSYVMTGGKRMIVDIQGVGDLWTDPQVHSTTDEEFGVGNMGLVGMAKFFRTYRYNPLCQWIGLIDFERSPAEKGEHIDWTEYAHDWKIEDLKNKKNPQAQSFSKRCRTLGGDVHLQLAKLYENGVFDEEINTEAAFFHVQKAADLGEREAHVILRKLYAGISQDHLVDYSVPEDSSKSFFHAREAAKLGDFNSMNSVAQYYDGSLAAEGVEVDYHRAIKWYQKLVEDHERMEDEEAVDNEEDFEMHKILGKMAAMYETGGVGLSASASKAAVLYNEAAVAAEHHFKAKLAAKYYEKAAELEALAEEEEEESEEESVADTATEGALSEPVSPMTGPRPGGSNMSLPSMLRACGESSPSTPGDSAAKMMHLDLGPAHAASWFEGAIVSMIDNFVTYMRSRYQEGASVVSEGEERKKVEQFLLQYEESKHQLDDELNPNHHANQKVWVMMCVDKPGQSALRESQRQHHSEHIRAHPGNVKLGGVLKDAEGIVKGTHMILRMSEPEAKLFLANDPYNLQGLYESTSLMEWEVEWNTLNVSSAAQKALFFQS